MTWESREEHGITPTVRAEEDMMEEERLRELISKLLPSSFNVSQIELLLVFYPSLVPNSASVDVMVSNLLLSRINFVSTLY